MLQYFVHSVIWYKTSNITVLTLNFSALVWRAMEDKESLKKRLTPLQYHVTQEAGTERPFTGKIYHFIMIILTSFLWVNILLFLGCYNKCYDEGMYVCVVCRQELFSSKTKYDSGCGWPAFNDVLAKEKVTLHQDTSAGIINYYSISAW